MNLSTIFDEHRNQHWWFIRPGGNWGDYLIYEGAEHLANSLGLRWQTVELPDFLAATDLPSNTCIYIHGSGGYNSWCSGTPFAILQKACHFASPLVVQGPSTLSEEQSFLETRLKESLAERQCERVVFFTRELVSLEVAQSLAPILADVEIGIDHDTAFLLRDSDRLQELSDDRGGSPIDLWVERADNEQNLSSGAPSPICLRIDPAEDCNSFAEWTRIHARAKRVFTNRLHSAIFAHLLGKQVVIYPGAYHKVHSVWEYSMKSEGALWGPTDYKAPTLAGLLPSRFYTSYKVKRYLYRRYFR